MSKLFVVSELFYPDETSTAFVMTKIVNKLAEINDDIEVICSDSNYDDSNLKSENYNLASKVKRVGIKSYKGSKNNLLLRTFRFFSLSLKMFFYLLRHVKTKDKVVIVTNPAPIIVLAYILKKIKSNFLVIIVHDVFPENTIPAGIFKSKNSTFYKFLLKIFNISYSFADRLIVVGRDVGKVILNKIGENNEEKIIVIENWAETSDVLPHFASPLKDKIVFQFAGNIGRVQGLKELLEVIKDVKNDLLEFHFVGDGAVKQELIDYCKENRLINVVFKPSYKREEQTRILNDSDIAIVTLSQGMFGLGVPSKSYNIMAAGKPILYIGDKDGEIDHVVNENNIGYSFENYQDLKLFFNSLGTEDKSKLIEMGKKARKLAETIYSEETILNKYQRFI
ncbi:glycosyltransferase family 4 protein [Soonwooa sp.]|uniref:glycosyltransferase family 4 protein n=1 Tax=Soonwooa sp. TaxID=1938592 RepID=UPI00262EC428|nr:glycosyltransferase family 4 protein [Soonwooa sp.]